MGAPRSEARPTCRPQGRSIAMSAPGAQGPRGAQTVFSSSTRGGELWLLLKCVGQEVRSAVFYGGESWECLGSPFCLSHCPLDAPTWFCHQQESLREEGRRVVHIQQVKLGTSGFSDCCVWVAGRWQSPRGQSLISVLF